MPITIHSESHLDHGLSPAHVAFLRERFADRTEAFSETVELPPELPSLPCGLHGPIMDDPPIGEGEVFYAPRGDRAWCSRMVSRPPRPSRLLTVIAGPHRGDPCVLYTAHAGPLAPRELESMWCVEQEEADASRAFWAVHALTGTP